MNIKSIIGIAGLVAILIIGIVFMRNNKEATDYQALYSEYASLDEIPSLTTRGVSDSVINLIETQFYEKHFEDVNTLISTNEERFDDDQKSLLSIYHGVSYGERGMYQEAYDVLSNAELYENSLYEQMSDWYLALALMNGESMVKAKQLFAEIAEDDNHYKQAQAVTILKRM